jgi:xanthosine utilization system XapX-like protein
MDLSWVDIAQPAVAGLAGMLGVYLVEDVLTVLRRRNLCPARWNR